MRRLFLCAHAVVLLVAASAAAQTASQVTAIRAGRLIDPDAGTAALNQVILVQDGKITAVGSNLAIPQGAEVIDLARFSVLPGLVDAHNHLALTYKEIPEHNVYYLTYVLDSTPLRAIQAASNGIQMLSSGFTIIRDMGNAGNYADTALRVAIDQGWIPGPTIINSGIIIGGMGGQFYPTPEMAKEHNIVYPEYLDADTNDEIVKAVRQNMLFGAKVIKICADCKPWGYSVDEIRLFVSEAARAGMKVEAHCQTVDGARRAIEGGVWSIAHDSGMTEENHRLMAQKGVWRAGTETPISLTGHTTRDRYDRTVQMLKNAHQLKVPLTFSTDADYWVPGKTRGELAIEFIETWKAAGIPAPDILRAITTHGYRVSETEKTRGPIVAGLAADLIAVEGNPLENIDALRRVSFVMKDGIVFKRDGVMMPERFFNPGPVKGWRVR
jgi:imidazolonepropionase-like amidohydrolase